jgi:hypothetical protein
MNYTFIFTLGRVTWVKVERKTMERVQKYMEKLSSLGA